MVSNTVILDTYSSFIEDLGYKISYNDIDSTDKNVIGLYLREAGNPIGTLDDSNTIYRIDLSIRLHGDKVKGSQEKCENDLVEIVKRFVFFNRKFTGINILGSSLRGRGVMIGKTSNNIPVYNISFLIQFN